MSDLTRPSSRELTPAERLRYAARALEREVAALRTNVNWLWVIVGMNTAALLLMELKG